MPFYSSPQDFYQKKDVILPFINMECIGSENEPCTIKPTEIHYSEILEDTTMTDYPLCPPLYIPMDTPMDTPLNTPLDVQYYTSPDNSISSCAEFDIDQTYKAIQKKEPTLMPFRPSIAPAVIMTHDTSHGSQCQTTINTKRQERLIRNRAAALLSRKRKKDQLNALEVKVKSLQSQVEVMRNEKQVLQTQSDTANVLCMTALLVLAICLSIRRDIIKSEQCSAKGK
ncbi:hypothetical protein BDF14DRAFT_1996811 [Spinellus fusiger]|nr:hypothetical protein BDF14DRAFT_1996811 [Spinellus fusiger]